MYFESPRRNRKLAYLKKNSPKCPNFRNDIDLQIKEGWMTPKRPTFKQVIIKTVESQRQRMLKEGEKSN